jgi:hypothetical protein
MMSGSESSRILYASDMLYRMLLFVYPAKHRLEYGPHMAQAFRDLCHDAHCRGGAWGLITLWIRTLVDITATAVVEHLDALENGGWAMMQHRSVFPLSWGKVGLTVLPGLFAISASWDLNAPDLIPITGLGLCLLLSMSGLARARRFPIWGLTTLGVLFSFLGWGGWWLIWGSVGLLAVVIGLIKYRQRGVHVPRLVWILLYLMIVAGVLSSGLWGLAAGGAMVSLVAAGLPLAKRNGLLAGLFVTSAGFILWETTLDLTYGMGKSPWGMAMISTLAVLLLVVSPLWVTRARSTRGQVWGLLLPTFVALASVAVINTTVRTDPIILYRIFNLRPVFLDDPLAHGISVGIRGKENLVPLLIRGGLATAQLFMGMVVAVVLYHWIERPASARDHLSDVDKFKF